MSSKEIVSILLLCCFRDRLSASDMLQVRKVMEHVYEKIINLDTESQTTNSSGNEKPGEQEKEEDVAVVAEEKIELMCQDQVRQFTDPHDYRKCYEVELHCVKLLLSFVGFGSKHGPQDC